MESSGDGTRENPILVCGSVAFDTIAVFEGRFSDHILPEHVKSLSVSFLTPSLRKEYGGCAGNIAYNLKLLGSNPVPVATVGEDANGYFEHLHRFGIHTSRIKVVPQTWTAQCFITTDLEGNQITAFHPGAMLYSAENEVNLPTEAWAIVAPDSKAGMFAHAQRFHAAHIPFIFDLGQAMPLFDGDDLNRMLGLAQALTANDYEAGVIEARTGRSMMDFSQVLDAVVITRGAAGATLWLAGKEYHIPPMQAVTTVDPTGCGDAHRAGILYGLALGWDWQNSCKLANIMGAIKIGSSGAQNHTPSRQVISDLLYQTYGLSLPTLASVVMK